MDFECLLNFLCGIFIVELFVQIYELNFYGYYLCICNLLLYNIYFIIFSQVYMNMYVLFMYYNLELIDIIDGVFM